MRYYSRQHNYGGEYARFLIVPHGCMLIIWCVDEKHKGGHFQKLTYFRNGLLAEEAQDLGKKPYWFDGMWEHGIRLKDGGEGDCILSDEIQEYENDPDVNRSIWPNMSRAT